MRNFENINLPLPVIKLIELPPLRELHITRQKAPRGDFGFSLRKAMVLDRTSSLLSPTFRSVIFAEPSANNNSYTGLLPGDRLLKVNGINVEELHREAIIDIIRNSGNTVTVQVKAPFLSRRWNRLYIPIVTNRGWVSSPNSPTE